MAADLLVVQIKDYDSLNLEFANDAPLLNLNVFQAHLFKGQVAVLVLTLKTSLAPVTFLGIYNVLLRVQSSLHLSYLVILFLPLAYMLVGCEEPHGNDYCI